MNKFYQIIAFAITFFCSSAYPSDSMKQFQDNLQEITRQSTESSAACVVRDNSIFQTSSKSVTSNTQFYIGSVSKHITAYIMLTMLHEQYPEARIQELLSEKLNVLFPHSDLLQSINKDWIPEISLLDLLTHRSGLSEYLDPYYTNYQILKLLEEIEPKQYSETISALLGEVLDVRLLEEIKANSSNYDGFIKNLKSGFYNTYIEQAKELNNPAGFFNLFSQVNFDPNKEHSYSNSNYLLAAKLIEELTGKTFDTIFQEKVAIPAKMEASYAPISGNYFEHQSSSNLSSNNGLLNGREIFIDMSNAIGAGNIISTIDDFIKWGRYFFIDDPKIIVDAMLENYGEDSDGDILNLGLGTDQTNLGDFIGHQGSIDSFNSFFGYIPQNDTLIITLSNNSDDANLFMESIISWLSEPEDVTANQNFYI